MKGRLTQTEGRESIVEGGKGTTAGDDGKGRRKGKERRNYQEGKRDEKT